MTYIVDKASDRLTVARLTGGSRFNEDGVLESIPAGALRFDYNPDTLAFMGVLTEMSATNLLLNTVAPASQSKTVTAEPHTLSFFGSGSVSMTGAHTELVMGITATQRQSSTFTPAEGTLNLALSGQVTMLQLEVGELATSFIPTTGAPATRGADGLSFDLPPGTYDITYLFDDDSTLALAAQSGEHAISGALSRRRIKKISARLSA